MSKGYDIMKIAIINGSPKGKYSITLKTSEYLERRYPEHEYRTLHAALIIKLLEKDFSRAREILEWADIIIFSYPVYTFLAPSQLHRFIELTKASGVDLSGKWAAQISTSKHFYDVTAAKYIEENIHDLGMRYSTGLLADMEDLLKAEGRREAVGFFEYLMYSVREGVEEGAPTALVEPYTPVRIRVPLTERVPDIDRDLLIITDECDTGSSLSGMIDYFRATVGVPTRVVNIAEYPLLGGCLGCLGCASSGKCVYPDGFDDFLREKIHTASAIVYAFTVRDHSMGSRFKMYDDRNFCNGHRTVTVGMPIAYLASGRYSTEQNLKTVIEARASVGHNYLAGVATDECDPEGEIDLLVKKLRFALENNYVPPQSFYGVGGMKIFRDLIYGMRGMMRADHKFYKKGGYYNDFPQKHPGKTAAMYLVGFMMSSERVRRKLGGKIKEGMLMPYTKLFEKEFGKKRKAKRAKEKLK